MAKSASNQALRFLVYGEYKRRVSAAGAPLSAAQALVGGMIAGWLGAVGNTPVSELTRGGGSGWEGDTCIHGGGRRRLHRVARALWVHSQP